MNLFLTPGTTPANFSLPGNAQAWVDFIAQYVLVGGADAIGGINYGSDTPSPENRGFPWWRTDVGGNPLGMYNWNGSAWVTIPSVISNGPTSSRPLVAAQGTEYFDTTISRALVWDRGQWRTLDGGIGEIREYEGASIDAVLTANPGWVEHSASAGRVIGGQSTDHPYGSAIGEDAHTIAINELPPHSHAIAVPTCSNSDNSDPGNLVCVSPNEPNASTPFASSTGAAGSGAAANVIQPTLYLYRIIKQ
jgi:hypothetical protein